ncbi:MAG: amino acid racemase [Pseudomonadota bacterium]
MKTVGIIGGMGPEATVDLMSRVIALTPATDDADHIPMLVDNNSQVPSRIAALLEGTGTSPEPVLIAMAERLQHMGAQLLAMPCNTAHHYHQAVQAAVQIPFLDMRIAAATFLAARMGKPGRSSKPRIGFLASSALPKISLYEPVFAAAGLDICYPDDESQRVLMALIRSVKGNGELVREENLRPAIASLVNSEVDSLLIACSELSAVSPRIGKLIPNYRSVPLFDSSEILASAIVEAALATS